MHHLYRLILRTKSWRGGRRVFDRKRPSGALTPDSEALAPHPTAPPRPGRGRRSAQGAGPGINGPTDGGVGSGAFPDEPAGGGAGWRPAQGVRMEPHSESHEQKSVVLATTKNIELLKKSSSSLREKSRKIRCVKCFLVNECRAVRNPPPPTRSSPDPRPTYLTASA